MRILNKLLFILPLICVITSCGDTELEAPEIIPSEPSVIFLGGTIASGNDGLERKSKRSKRIFLYCTF